MKKLLTRILSAAACFALAIGVSACGEKKEADHVCSFGDWTEVKAAKCEEDGEERRDCACGKFETRTIPQTGHEYEDGVCSCGERLSSEGLQYALSADGSYYTVTGIGSCKDEVIGIPETYEEKPVRAVGASAFQNQQIEGIVFPDGLTTIGEFAFMGCENMVRVVIPESVTSIGACAFTGGSLTIYAERESKGSWPSNWNNASVPTVWNCDENDVASDGYVYLVSGGIRYALKDGVATVAVQPRSTVTAEIPSAVTYKETSYNVVAIKDGAFRSCAKLTTVKVGENVTSIGASAFRACAVLAVIELPESVTSIGEYAFYGCAVLAVIELPESVTSIGQYTFYGCAALTEVKLSESVTSIGEYAFYGCAVLAVIELPESVASIGQYTFYGCAALTEVKLPESVTSIGEYAFYGCVGLTEVVIPSGVVTLGKLAFSGNEILIVYCVASDRPKGWASDWCGDAFATVWDCNSNDKALDGYVYKIVDGVLYCLTNGQATLMVQASNLVEANICASITHKGVEYKIAPTIGAIPFQNCTAMKKVVVPEGVTALNGAFDGCRELTEVELPSTLERIGASTFFGCRNLTEIEIPDGVVFIGNHAFSNCVRLKSVVIPESVVEIEQAAFDYCERLVIYCEAKEKPEGWQSSWVYYNYTKTSIPVVWNCNETEATKDGYLYPEIDGIRYALWDGKARVYKQLGSLTSLLEIPETVTYKNNEYAVVSIGDYAFENCTGLTHVEIPNGVTEIGVGAFSGCSQLMKVTIPSSVNSIGSSAFTEALGLTIYCEKTLSEAAYGTHWKKDETPVVWDCKNNDVASDGYVYAIVDGIRYALKDGEATVAVQPKAAVEVKLAATVTYKETAYKVVAIGDYAFQNCKELTSVVVPEGVATISNYAFQGCSALKSILLPDSVTSIGNRAFDICGKLTEIVLPEGLRTIGEYAFSDCVFEKVVLPKNVESIGVSAFQHCLSLKEVMIGEGVTLIAKNAFAGCSALSSVSFANPSGWWYATTAAATSGRELSQADLSNSVTAREYLRNTYASYYWKRSE